MNVIRKHRRLLDLLGIDISILEVLKKNKEGTTIKTLIEETKQHRTTIAKALARLIKKNLVKKKKININKGYMHLWNIVDENKLYQTIKQELLEDLEEIETSLEAEAIKKTIRLDNLNKFFELLEGKSGCDFKEEGEPKKTTWRCNHKYDHTKKIFLEHFKELNVKDFLIFCKKNGGHCDCEILFNVANKLSDDWSDEVETEDKEK